MPTTSIKNAYCCMSKVSSKYIVEQNVLFIHHGAILGWHGAGMKAADSVVQRGCFISLSFEVSCFPLQDLPTASVV